MRRILPVRLAGLPWPLPASLIPELEEVVQHGSAEKRAEMLSGITNLFLDGAAISTRIMSRCSMT